MTIHASNALSTLEKMQRKRRRRQGIVRKAHRSWMSKKGKKLKINDNNWRVKKLIFNNKMEYKIKKVNKREGESRRGDGKREL